VDYLRLLPARHAYTMQKYYGQNSAGSGRTVFGKILRCIICDFIYPAGVLNWKSETPIVLFTHNVEAEVWERQYRLSKNPIRKLMFGLEYVRLTRCERYYAERARACWPFPKATAVFRTLRRRCGTRDAAANRRGHGLLPACAGGFADRNLVFTGSMDWAPNQDAMEYFTGILPLIRVEEPEVETWMVGRNLQRR